MSRSPTGLARAAALLILLAAAAAPAAADWAHVDVECESYTNSLNIAGTAIGGYQCFGASGGWMVEGVDSPGEWIELEVTLPQNRVYTDSLALQAPMGFPGIVRLTVYNPDPHGIDFMTYHEFTGAGFGCGNPILWIPGDSTLPLSADTYTIRIEHVEQAATYLDLIRFAWDDTPARVTTLGRVKALYR